MKYAKSIAGSSGIKIAANGNIDATDGHKHVPFTMLAMDLKFAGQRACHRSEHYPLLAKNALPSNNHIASSWTRAKLFASRQRAGKNTVIIVGGAIFAHCFERLCAMVGLNCWKNRNIEISLFSNLARVNSARLFFFRSSHPDRDRSIFSSMMGWQLFYWNVLRPRLKYLPSSSWGFNIWCTLNLYRARGFSVQIVDIDQSPKPCRRA